METRERIISVAEELFSKHGYETASVRQITEKARVNVASINYHFRVEGGALEGTDAAADSTDEQRALFPC